MGHLDDCVAWSALLASSLFPWKQHTDLGNPSGQHLVISCKEYTDKLKVISDARKENTLKLEL